jgi:hypothetical protein
VKVRLAASCGAAIGALEANLQWTPNGWLMLELVVGIGAFALVALAVLVALHVDRNAHGVARSLVIRASKLLPAGHRQDHVTEWIDHLGRVQWHDGHAAATT